MNRRVLQCAAVLAVVAGSFMASEAQAFFFCRPRTTVYYAPAPVVYQAYYAPAPVCYQPTYYQAAYQPVYAPVYQPAYVPVYQAAYQPAAYEPVPVQAAYAQPTYYDPTAVVPATYVTSYRDHVKVHIDRPGPDYRYDYRRTGNYVRVRESY